MPRAKQCCPMLPAVGVFESVSCSLSRTGKQGLFFSSEDRMPLGAGVTPMNNATRYGYGDIVHLFLQVAPDALVWLQAKDSNGRMPFDVAKSRNHLSLLPLLESAPKDK